MRNLTKTQIKDWLTYWAAARMVAIENIRAFDQVYEARKYCQCMRVGVFVEVTDLQIWCALKELRDEGHPLAAAA